MRITNNYRFITNSLNRFNKAANKNATRIASGRRINSASDDASGLARVQKLKMQINGLNTANDNIKTANDMVVVADKALENITELAQNINELHIQKENGTLSDAERNSIQTAIDEYSAQISNIFENTKFNDMKVFSGKNISIHTGASSNDKMNIKINNIDLDFSTLDATQESINKLSAERSKMGAYENVLESKINVNAITAENLESSRSKIEDADIEKEYIEYTKNTTLQELSQLILSEKINNDKNFIKSFFA